MSERRQPRYETIAQFITELVDKGALEPGAKAPSLRDISRQHRVSVSTAMRAYQLLEERGVLEVRPQSGHYVATALPKKLETPAKSKPSSRASSIRVSQRVLQLLEYASDPRFIPLGCAIPSPEVLAAGALDRVLARTARMRGSELNIYTAPKGDPQLRQEIARRSARWGHVISPDDIAITCGCTEALLLALKAVSRPGDTIAVESPTYFGLLHAIEQLGLKALELPTDAASGVDISALARALKQNRIAACLFSSSFNNPLGCSVPDANRVAILDLLSAKKIPLIEDDTYGELFFGHDRVRPYSAFDRRGNTIYCGSFSKTIAPGYRLGWIATDRLMDHVLEQKFSTTLSSPALSQAALADFLSSGRYDGHLRRLRRIFATSIANMSLSVSQHFPAATRLSRPAGGFALWVELAGRYDTRRLLSKAMEVGIYFAPGDVFSADGRFRNCLRLSCGYGWEPRIQQAVERLGALAKSLT